MKFMQYLIDLFFKIFALREFYTLSLSIAYCLIESEPKPDEEVQTKLNYIREHSHANLDLPLAITEQIILRNLGANMSKSVEFKNNKGVTQEMPLNIIIKYAKDSYFDIAMLVTKIAKKYDVSIPIRGEVGMMELPTFTPETPVPSSPSLK